jgi:hypothetical protein
MRMRIRLCLLTGWLHVCASTLYAQTEHDAIMMNRGQWCNGAAYTSSQWKNYWEGTYKRNNLNIGALQTQSVVAMSDYGITNKLNIMAGLPYIVTNASQGTLHGMKGFQDAALFLKWKPVTATVGKGKLSLLAVGGVSTPVSNYTLDFLPLSIGLGATTITGRVMSDYQYGIFFATLAAAYVRRSNVQLDRTAYYTTGIHYTNKISMPDAAMYDMHIGIRKKYLVAEAGLSNMTTLGGFDIRKNDMPFPSNTMNSTTAGMHVKYTLPCFSQVEFTGDASYVIAGRNVGQATTWGVGGYYIFSFHQKKAAAAAK